ncbi:hypothetical protein BDN71DRAFT_1430848 [Pleurotus eryngii]|uniref:Uncharacterized protein n=1 Tax=Pleurotus eryngii TaxID=5323 RepID=A0A9P5ZYU7_PLEER|nr:hypothetical protein BDN71DRAFT_1430848 [Pleurotus eryngii]
MPSHQTKVTLRSTKPQKTRSWPTEQRASIAMISIKPQLVHARPFNIMQKQLSIMLSSEMPGRDCCQSCNDPVTVSGWLAWTTKLHSKFAALMKGNTTTFTEGLYQGYVVSCQKDKICDAIIELEGLQNATTHCLDGILQLAGVGKDLDKVQHLNRLIREALSWLEDIMCYIVGGYSEVIEMYTKRRLLYQAFM